MAGDFDQREIVAHPSPLPPYRKPGRIFDMRLTTLQLPLAGRHLVCDQAQEGAALSESDQAERQ